MLLRSFLILMIGIPLLLCGQDVPKKWIVGSSDMTEANKYYLTKTLADTLKQVRRLGDWSIVRGDQDLGQAIELTNDWKWIGDDRIRLGKENYYVLLQEPEKLAGTKVLHQINSSLFMIETNKKGVNELLDDPNVIGIQLANRKPKTEATIRQHDLNVNKINLTHHEYPMLDGEGFKVSVKENTFDILDFDIATRAISDVFSSEVVELHATEMSTLIGGSGNSYISGKGVASAVTLYATNFANLNPEPSTYYTDRGITIQNHSYGVGVENFYGVESAAYDELIIEHPELLHVFSLGNAGTLTGTGIYDGLPGYGTITGSFKQAKNVLLINSSDSLDLVSDLNSRGPAYDGRIKPDIVAFGGEGTSEAAALVSGAAVLIQQHFSERNGSLPTSDLVRGLLIAGADDLLNVGPDFISGYGKLNLYQSLQIVDDAQYLQDTIEEGEIDDHVIAIPSEVSKATFAVVWNDPPANPGDPMALVNDLNFTISKDGSDWLPWILDSTPNTTSLTSPATRGIDNVNNVEVITIDDPESGNYSLNVEGFSVMDAQPYAICYRFDQDDRFMWTYPTSSDVLITGNEHKLRWSSTLSETIRIEVDYLEDSWNLVSEVSSDEPFLEFQNEGQSKFAKLRAITTAGVFESDTFLIVPEPRLYVDLNCDEELILTWDRIDLADYSVKKYANGTLHEIGLVSDTSIIIDRSEHQESHYAVQPIIDGKESLSSFLINVEQQGVGCYLNSFLSFLDRENESVLLTVGLAGVSQISDVDIEKSIRGGAYQVLETAQPTSNTIEVNDPDLTTGITSYRVKVNLLDGTSLMSDERSVLFADDETYIGFPNPIIDRYFYFLSPESGGLLELINGQGKVVSSFDLESESEYIELPELPIGLYHYRVVQDNIVKSKGKLLIKY